MRRMVITGVAGLIGSHLADALLEREDTMVVGVDDLSVGVHANIAHLEENAAALEKPYLPTEDARRVVQLFGDIVEYV